MFALLLFCMLLPLQYRNIVGGIALADAHERWLMHMNVAMWSCSDGSTATGQLVF